MCFELLNLWLVSQHYCPSKVWVIMRSHVVGCLTPTPSISHHHTLPSWDSHRLLMSFVQCLIDSVLHVPAEWLHFHPLKGCLHHSCAFFANHSPTPLDALFHTSLSWWLPLCSDLKCYSVFVLWRSFLYLLFVNINWNDQWNDPSFISFRLRHLTFVLGWKEWPTNGSPIGSTEQLFKLLRVL